MTINHNDAPPGFVALQANLQHCCRGCHFERKHACPMREPEDVLYCEDRADQAQVIFEQVK